MKIILLKDVPKIGKKYEIKDMAQGYAQNMLIPKGLAAVATPSEVSRIELIKSRVQGELKVHKDLLEKNLAVADGQTVVIRAKANDKGHLFAGIHTDALMAEITKQLLVTLPVDSIDYKQPIKEVGEFMIGFKAGNKTATVMVKVEAVK